MERIESKMRPNRADKRLRYIAGRYPEPEPLYYAIEAALELHGIHDRWPPARSLMLGDDESWNRVIRRWLDENESLFRVHHRYDRYLPWVAEQVHRMPKWRGSRTGSDLSLELRSIGDWAQAQKIDLAEVPAETAIEEARRWSRERKPVDVTHGSVVLRFDNGWTVQELTTQEQLNDEGEAMQHCVGEYCDLVGAEAVRIYSLRDPGGMPHVTIETDPSGVLFKQIRGKQNRKPIKDYWPYLGAFIAHRQGDPPAEVLRIADTMRSAAIKQREAERRSVALVLRADEYVRCGDFDKAAIAVLEANQLSPHASLRWLIEDLVRADDPDRMKTILLDHFATLPEERSQYPIFEPFLLSIDGVPNQITIRDWMADSSDPIFLYQHSIPAFRPEPVDDYLFAAREEGLI